MTAVRVGIFAPVGQFSTSLDQRKSMLAAIGDSGIDHVCVGDHVSFHVGAGADALIDAASMLTHYADLPCYVGFTFFRCATRCWWRANWPASPKLPPAG